MFTMLDLEKAKSEKNRIFSAKKSKLSYELSKMTGRERGVCAEKMLYHKFVADGLDVEYLGGAYSCDMLINKNETIHKVEVKLATYTPNGYLFRNVKYHLFNILFLVFVTPHGVIVRWTTSNNIRRWCWDKQENHNGYTIHASCHRTIKNLELSDFSDFSV